jgi:hypothetical protein
MSSPSLKTGWRIWVRRRSRGFTQRRKGTAKNAKKNFAPRRLRRLRPAAELQGRRHTFGTTKQPSGSLAAQMTLIVTIVGPTGIHQSADFRLSRIERCADGTCVEVQPNSSKIVCLRYEKWSGLLTYCGIGLWNGKRTDEYATEWLVGLPNSSSTFQDVVETIHKRGTAWIAGIQRSLGKEQIHSFVLSGYEGGAPVIAIVSNYQTLTGRIAPICNELKVDIRRSATGAHVLVSGIRSAVPEATRRRLKRLVKIGTDANVIRHELGNINRLAARSPLAKNGISTSCLAYSLDVHGGGAGEVHGDVPGPLIPRMVLGGIDVANSVARIFPGCQVGSERICHRPIERCSHTRTHRLRTPREQRPSRDRSSGTCNCRRGGFNK